jgi:hypothetical protein
MMRRLLLSGVCILSVLAGVLWAQSDRATITGTVSDPSGAVVPGVSVTATNLDTGVRTASVSNDVGIYTLLNLPIGRYSVTFAKEGFHTLDRAGISLAIAQVLKLDATLPVGHMTEMVTVEADASPLATETSVVGSNMKAGDLKILPLSVFGGRDISQFAYATVPTVQGDYYGGKQLTGYDLASSTKIAGSQSVTKALVVDGTDYNAGIQGVQPAPGMEAVQEFEVQTVVGADSFATGGGAFIYTLKSGTNKFHGSAFGIMANEILHANSWTNNHDGKPKDKDRYNDWGFSAGGPVYIPWLYNGRNKTFIFGAYEHYDQTDLRWVPYTRTVPTEAMLNGDFSALLGSPLCDDGTVAPCTGAATPLVWNGQQVLQGMIFDPTTGNPFPGNLIPPDRISTLSKTVLGFYQQYYQPENSALINNYGSLFNTIPIIKKHNLDIKVDQNFGQKNHLSASINYTRNPALGAAGWSRGTSDGGPIAGESKLTQTKSKGIRFIDDHTFSPTFINTLSVAYNNYRSDEVTASPLDNAALGFPVPEGAAKNNFPMIDYENVFTNGTYVGSERVGSRYGYTYIFNQWHVRDSLAWLKGRHNFKFGGEIVFFRPEDTGGSQNYWYTFARATGLPDELRDSPAAYELGFGFANMMLGNVAKAQRGVSLPTSAGRNGINLFFNDSIKLTQTLTVNAGLRWEFNTRYREYSGRWTNFNPEAVNPAWDPVKGAYEYASSPSDSWERNQFYDQFAPYVGASFQALPSLVLRGAWGMHYVPLGLNQWGALPYNLFNEAHAGYVGASGTYGFAPNQIAFNWDQTSYGGTEIPSSTDPTENRIHPWFSDGGTVSIDPNILKMGRTQNWNLGVEYQVGKNAVLSANYLGNKGSRLHNGGLDPRNYPTWESYRPLLLSGHAGDFIWDDTSAGAAGVPWYPFLATIGGGWGGYYAYNGLAPFPQLVDHWSNPINFVGSPLGASGYHAFVVEFKKRYSHGLVANLNYAFQRATGNTNGAAWSEGWDQYSGLENPYNYADFSDSVTHSIPHHDVKGYLVWELPFGRGRSWLNTAGALNQLVGGWQIGTVVRYRSGFPLFVPGSSNYYPGWSAVWAKRVGDVSDTFDGLGSVMYSSSAWQNPPFGELAGGEPYSYDFTGWSYFNEDFSVNKSFAFGADGRFRASLRVEFFDVFNRHQWSEPVLGNIDGADFGRVLSATGNRRGQFGARFEW